MNDIKELQKTIVRLISLASGLANNKIQTVRGGMLPQISGTYCTVSLTQDDTIGKPSTAYSESATPNVLNETIRAAKQFTLSLNFFRTGALQSANVMQGAMYRSDVKAFLFQNNLGWFNYGPINNLTSVFSGESEERAQANMTLVANGETVSQINQALSVEVDVKGEHTPEIITFYAYEPQDQGDFIAFENKPHKAA